MSLFRYSFGGHQSKVRNFWALSQNLVECFGGADNIMNIMKNDPLISVIVPVYKVEKELDRCVESVIRQTYTHFELILVDDGSPDSCPEKCDSWAASDTRIKVLHTSNQGLSAARNTGIANASGELIAFVDSDDYVDACFLEKLFDAMMSNDADIACCGIKEEDGLTGENKDVTLFASNFCLSSQKMLRDASFYEWQYVVAWNKLYRKEMWSSISYPVGRYHEDEFVYHRLLMCAGKIAFICDPLYHYVQRGGSIMMTPSFSRVSDIVHAMDERMSMLKGMKGCEGVLISAYGRMTGEYSTYIGSDRRIKSASVKELSSLCRDAAWLISIHRISLKKKINILGFRLSPYLYARVRTYIKSFLRRTKNLTQ